MVRSKRIPKSKLEAINEGLRAGHSLNNLAKTYGISYEVLRGKTAMLRKELAEKRFLVAGGPKPPPLTLRTSLFPLPPGDPVSWGVLTQGTLLEGCPYRGA